MSPPLPSPLPADDQLQFTPADPSDPTLQRLLATHHRTLERSLPVRAHAPVNVLAIHRREDSVLLGLASIALREPPRTLAFDLWIAPPFRNAGHGTRAGRLLLQAAFTEWGCTRVETAHPLGETAAARLVEKLGFLPEGVARQAYRDAAGEHDLAHYGILAQDRD